MTEKNSRQCSSGPKLIFACSGCADVGEIADRAARKMTRDGAGRMFCLAGVAGCVEPILNTTRQASKILAVDGCELDCVEQCLEHAGFTDFEHMRVTDLGIEKGKAQVTDQNINVVTRLGTDLLG